jgi:hypothetical protein
VRSLVLLAAAAASVLPAQSTQESPYVIQAGPIGGPTQLIITYRCPPPRRAAFRQYMTEVGLQRFDHWKQDGLLTDYRFVFNWFADADTWDAMVILSFSDYGAVGRWKDVEKTSPGGLARDGIDMAWPLNTYSVDLLAQQTAEPSADTTHGIYFVTTYDFPTAAAFRDYANVVLTPQQKALVHEGAVSGAYTYINRYPGGKRWQGISVVIYKNIDTFGRRDEILSKIKTQLRADPAYRAAESKQNPDREPVIAEPLSR